MFEHEKVLEGSEPKGLVDGDGNRPPDAEGPGNLGSGSPRYRIWKWAKKCISNPCFSQFASKVTPLFKNDNFSFVMCTDFIIF